MAADTGELVPADVDLVASGWTRRNRTAAAQVPELRAMYEELGFEVLVQESVRGDFEEKCGSCGDAAACSLVLVYTRVNGSG